MLFNSIDFWLFLPVVLGLFAALRTSRSRLVLLLAASYFFYGFWDWRFLGLIILSTLVDYAVALRLDNQSTKESPRKRLVALSVIVNLGILGLFKYAGFFIAEAQAFLGIASSWTLSLILPIGISFYTFQTLGYTLDVYRRRMPAERDFLTFATFVAFFPQLMAGPIERARDLLPQLRQLQPGDLSSGLQLFLLGMVKKVFISTALATHCDLLYLNPGLRSPAESWLMGLLMFMHILMDFSGYSDMAIGLGRMFGVRLSRNFSSVWASQTFPDLWRRWHITLGRWFRDYVLVPLHRRGVPRPLAYLMTFALIGLWHGASWNFVTWGALMGVAWLVDSRLAQSRARLPRPIGSALTIGLFILLGQLFPTRSLADGFALMTSMLGFAPAQPLPMADVPGVVWLALALGLAIEWAAPRWPAWTARHPSAARWLLGLVLIPGGIALCLEGLTAAREFVYFQF
jgi:D-alanyl-lipoteichoic acid acyltransferase DltB (MBOAT superfamily)